MCPALAQTLSCQIPAVLSGTPPCCPTTYVAASTLPLWRRRGTALPGPSAGGGVPFSLWGVPTRLGVVPSVIPQSGEAKRSPRQVVPASPTSTLGPLYAPGAGLALPLCTALIMPGLAPLSHLDFLTRGVCPPAPPCPYIKAYKPLPITIPFCLPMPVPLSPKTPIRVAKAESWIGN